MRMFTELMRVMAASAILAVVGAASLKAATLFPSVTPEEHEGIRRLIHRAVVIYEPRKVDGDRTRTVYRLQHNFAVPGWKGDYRAAVWALLPGHELQRRLGERDVAVCDVFLNNGEKWPETLSLHLTGEAGELEGLQVAPRTGLKVPADEHERLSRAEAATWDGFWGQQVAIVSETDAERALVFKLCRATYSGSISVIVRGDEVVSIVDSSIAEPSLREEEERAKVVRDWQELIDSASKQRRPEVEDLRDDDGIVLAFTKFGSLASAASCFPTRLHEKVLLMKPGQERDHLVKRLFTISKDCPYVLFRGSQQLQRADPVVVREAVGVVLEGSPKDQKVAQLLLAEIYVRRKLQLRRFEGDHWVEDEKLIKELEAKLAEYPRSDFIDSLLATGERKKRRE